MEIDEDVSSAAITAGILQAVEISQITLRLVDNWYILKGVRTVSYILRLKEARIG